jgi:DNA-binding GntR family transcriptional regulator
MARATGRLLQRKDEAAAAIIRLILSGDVREGQSLGLPRLAARFAMSVTPVREALLILTQEGWVIQEPNRGFRVAPLRKSEIADTFLVRAFLASELAARAALRLDDRELAEISAIDRRLHTIAVREAESIVQLNERLHSIIDSAADSPRLSFIRGTTLLYVPNMADVPAWLEHTRKSHGPMLDAFRRRDPDAARTLAGEHYAIGSKMIMDYWDAIDLWSDEEALLGAGGASAQTARSLGARNPLPL